VEGVSVTAENQPKPLTFGRIVRRLPLYFGLAFVCLVAMTLLIVLSIHFGLNQYITRGWFGLVGYTGVLFWVVIRQGRAHWHRWRFWLVTVSLLATHCSTFVSILRVYPEFRMIWFWPITLVEAGLVGATIEWLFPEKHTNHHRKDGRDDRIN